ncbi:MAG: hypothetical protein COB35_04985 [Gammaproteobacteria bacterium]|nr:MAG: hypothetical protein COB35_04985 [Gammaproteobacteria bacterium]
MTNSERRRAFNKAIKQALADKSGLLTLSERRILELLTLAISQITDVLGNQPSDYQQWFLPQIEQQIYPLLNNFSLNASAIFKEVTNNAALAGIAMFDTPLIASGVQMLGITPLIIPEQVAAIATFGGSRISDISQKAKLLINSELGLTLIGTQTSHQAIQNIGGYLKSSPIHRIKTIVKTELSRAYASASAQRFSQLATLFPDLQKQWHKSGKFHARESHVAADKQIVAQHKNFTIGGVKMRYPHDPKAPANEVINCGCTMTPYLKSWQNLPTN